MASIHAEAEQEALRFKWIESEKAGRDLGEEALRQWVQQHWHGFLRSRWLEHLQGKRFWMELDRNDFGVLQREYGDDALLVDRILDRLKAGQENLDIVSWAVTWGIAIEPVVRILEALDVNSGRLVYQFDTPDDPPIVTLDPSWLAWHDGTVPRLAQGIADEAAYDALPILADALEDAGCDDAVILGHCRSAGRQARRSWVVEMILRAS